MFKLTFVIALLALAISISALSVPETSEHTQSSIFRGPCGGRGRAARMCRAMDDGAVNCKVVGCKRGVRRGFRCTCRPVKPIPSPAM